jgi:hypothetical protein
MKLQQQKKQKKGEPTGNVRVLIAETLYGVSGYKKSESFNVYDTNAKTLKEFILKKIEEEVK